MTVDMGGCRARGRGVARCTRRALAADRLGRGEPFYRGRPASFWSGELHAVQAFDPYGGWSCFVLLSYRRPLEPLASVQRMLGLAPTYRQVAAVDVPFADDDPTAAPVLAAILADPNAGIRWRAVVELSRRRAVAYRPQLAARLSDPDESVRLAAVEALVMLGPATDQQAAGE